FRFARSQEQPLYGRNLPPEAKVSLTVRVDIEDRNFHTETERTPGSEHHFTSHSRPLPDQVGFTFTPTADRRLQVYAESGVYHHEAEWSTGIFHPVEASRGQRAYGDAFSPGWFDLPMGVSSSVMLTLDAELESAPPGI